MASMPGTFESSTRKLSMTIDLATYMRSAAPRIASRLFPYFISC
jgi:hypothetical protein